MAAIVSPKQARNLAKKLRLARATTGHEQAKHYQDIEKMIRKYGIVIPDMQEVDFQKTVVESIDSQRETQFNNLTKGSNKRKIFYHYNEFSGWRFYWKAITRLDYRSLIGHIKDLYFSKTYGKRV